MSKASMGFKKLDKVVKKPDFKQKPMVKPKEFNKAKKPSTSIWGNGTPLTHKKSTVVNKNKQKSNTTAVGLKDLYKGVLTSSCLFKIFKVSNPKGLPYDLPVYVKLRKRIINKDVVDPSNVKYELHDANKPMNDDINEDYVVKSYKSFPDGNIGFLLINGVTVFAEPHVSKKFVVSHVANLFGDVVKS